MVSIENGSVEDVDAVADLWVELAAGQREFGSHLFAGENRATVREAIAKNAVADELLVARAESETEEATDEPETDSEQSSEIVGFVTFSIESGSYDRDVTRGLVQNVFVVSDHRGQGIGSDLLGEAETLLAERGADAISLEVMADNEEARRFYQRHGYTPHRIELEKSVENDTLTKE
jgi:ribosomal protein S18 acetylase RimI-like enzyme